MRLRELVKPTVSEIKHKVKKDHNKVQNVEEKDVPFKRGGGELRDNTRNIAKEDQAQKEQAFSLGGSRLVGFDDVEGPRGTKAKNHNNF